MTEPTGPSGLDEPQSFASATSYEVRDEMEALIRRDLLGPWDGPTERLTGPGPCERYLVGRLGPKHDADSVRKAADEMPDTESSVVGDGEAELPEVMTPQNLGRIWASSMGLSFTVGHDVDVVHVTATWGRYDKREEPDAEGTLRRIWEREPMAYEREVRLDGGDHRVALTEPDPRAPGVFLAVAVRDRDGRRVVEVALVNSQRQPDRPEDPAWLFQPTLSVTANDGAAAIFRPIDDPLDEPAVVAGDSEEQHLRLLYRDQRRYAAGRNVAVHASVRDGERSAYRLVTTWIPTYDVPSTIAPTGEDTALGDVTLSMRALAEASPDGLRAGLTPLVAGYTAWLDERERAVPDLPEHLRTTAVEAVAAGRRAAERIQAGITLLTDSTVDGHESAFAAFGFANQAMADQRRSTEVARLRDEGLSYREAGAKVDAKGASVASWRPFQLAFVLLNLPAITDPAHPERAADHTAILDLLFFPTGGGKTEAYLGLTAYTFAIRRLQAVVGTGADARDGGSGVAVLMRYTLRLLTAQQFQRAAALVCAAELIRRENEATWGSEPFRIGLWVGGGVSPNTYTKAAEQIAEARDAGSGRRANVLQTLTCPWCGSALRAERDVALDDAARRVRIFCPEAEGVDACPFAQTRTSEGLPILTVDEEIYRLAPSLVIATVDKLAQLPRRGEAGMLFGQVRERCPRHGYRHDDLDKRTGCGSRHNARAGLPAATSESVRRLRPPDLVIQDELHLISGALGTTVGLFEAAVDELCTWTAGGRLVGPKIVASTATTKRANAQVLGVFGRDLAVFPPQVTEITDTFFSRQEPVTRDTPGRRYLGLCAHGVRLKAAEIRLAEILLLAGQTAFDTYGEPADPYMTVVGYFNATRELAGMRRYLDDQVTTRVRQRGRREGVSDRIPSQTGMLTISELTSRISSGEISDVLRRLEIGFDPRLDTTERRRAIAADTRAALNAKPPRPVHPLADRQRDRSRAGQVPVDVVLATSMLQVGVDVSRFGLMVVTGQPKNTAEYIQASSRVGRVRERPGLVVTLYNPSRPRDLAHFEDFEHYHATFYRQVEALSVTPYTRRSLDRGTAAMFVAAVRNADPAHSRNADAHDVDLDGPAVRRVVERMLDRAGTAGGQRGRFYLAERINRFKEAWARERTGQARLGYESGQSGQQHLVGLLEPAGQGPWTDRTVSRSMRETEGEINLLVPGGQDVLGKLYDAPEWTFARPSTEDDVGDDPDVDGDELGRSTQTGPAPTGSTGSTGSTGGTR